MISYLIFYATMANRLLGTFFCLGGKIDPRVPASFNGNVYVVMTGKRPRCFKYRYKIELPFSSPEEGSSSNRYHFITIEVLDPVLEKPVQ
jgi:hypothetical protein